MRYVFIFLFLMTFGYSAVSEETLNQRLNEHIHFSKTEKNKIGRLYIGGHNTQISQGTYIYVKNALEYYKNKKPIFIILELDTPGGELFAAQKISDALKAFDTQEDIPVIAYINNWAISAGAMLAYSCRYITVVKDGSMGAAEPITQTGEKTSEKVNSAVRADFANRAAFFDRNPLIAEAMVDADMVLVVRDGKIISLPNDAAILPQDVVITRKGKLLTLNSKEMYDLGVADLRLLPQKLQPITHEEEKEGTWPASKELLFTYPFFQTIPLAEIISYTPDWKTEFFTLLTLPFVTSLLFLGLIISLYIEISTPGFGLAGVVALLCLVFIILGSFASFTSSWLELILLTTGIVLILIEIFVLPGFGAAGIIGILLALIGLIGLVLPGIREVHFDFETKTLNAAGQYLLVRLMWLAMAFIIGIVVISVLARFIVPQLRKFSPLIHRKEQDTSEGYVAGQAANLLPGVGACGIAFSPLRIAGKVLIDNEIYDAVSSGSFIEKGAKVKVIKIEGSKIIVEEEE